MDKPALVFYPDKTLEFEAQSGAQSQVTLRLENPHDRVAAFKIKTTAPKSYLVKPSSGVIEGRQTQSISILLMPQFEKQQHTTSADRFLIQSTFIASAVPLSKEEWSTIRKDKLEEKKLNVNIVWTARLDNSIGAPPVSNNVSVLAAKPLPNDYSGLKIAYEELLTIAITLERQNRELTAERDGLPAVRHASHDKRIPGSQFELWQIGMLLVVTLVILKLCRII
ncbi:putative vesicle-associated membrane protein [Gregarina niphandrodes]|uniref:Vesicle-associated membrane protein n=1 Tax=Gregarina niphandrodes TaxID=110365 RepID=A0A023AXX3_GRENI|nr:putative vesicle-associated membrane protein [Gregarina niphandrodes]EZG43502.1 putative vesicle-associated membrane protein [Gregarina niphandrodes]|eukprot:XP_011133265.1 putative vesicle-associated membrane protein [Gregarina niphandrodes]